MTDDQHEPTPANTDAVDTGDEHEPSVDETPTEGRHVDPTDDEPAPEELHGEDDRADEDDDPIDESPHTHRRTMNDINAVMLGTLTVCYPERDVQILLDGDAAMRTIAAFRTGRRHEFENTLDPTKPAAACGWVALDMNPMAMWWVPAVPTAGSTRMTIDPEPVSN